MSEEPDFEALGRYVHAKRQVDELRAARESLAVRITALLAPGHNAKAQLRNIDMDEVHRKVAELDRVNSDLMAAVEAANQWSGRAGERPVR